MANWKKVGVNVLVGGAAGAVDQLIQNADDNRGNIAAASGKAGAVDKNGKLPILKQFGTYVNYGIPAAIVIGVATNFIKEGDMATRLLTAGAQLASRKVTHQLTTKATSKTPSAAWTEWARAGAAHRDLYQPSPNPQPQSFGPGTPIVQPQILTGIRGMTG